jgi:ribonuclease Y
MNSTIIAGAVIFVIGILCGFWLRLWRERSLHASLEQEQKATLEKARGEADSILRDARLAANEEALKLRAETEELIAARHKQIAVTEQRLSTREELLNGQLETLVNKENILRCDREELGRKSAEIEALRDQAAKLLARRRADLAGVSKMSENEVRAAFLKQIEQESMGDAMKLSQHILDEAKSRAEEKARKIITLAIQRYAGQHSQHQSRGNEGPDYRAGGAQHPRLRGRDRGHRAHR